MPLIDLKDDLPPLIDLTPMGELLEEAIGDQNYPIYHLILEEAITHHNTFDIDLDDLMYGKIAKIN